MKEEVPRVCDRVSFLGIEGEGFREFGGALVRAFHGSVAVASFENLIGFSVLRLAGNYSWESWCLFYSMARNAVHRSCPCERSVIAIDALSFDKIIEIMD